MSLNFIEIGIPIASNLIIIAFSFGKISSDIKNIQRDIDDIKDSMKALPKLQAKVAAIEAVEEYKKN